MSRHRIYHLITELRPAGAERILHELTRGLDPDRFEVRVGSLRSGGAVGEWLRDAGIPVRELGLERHRVTRWPGALRALVRDLRAFRPHLLHTHLFHAGLVGRLAATLAGLPPVVSHVHIVERRRRPWRDPLDRLTRSLVQVELCVSGAVARHRRRRVGAPVRVLHNGVDLERACRCTSPPPPGVDLDPARPRIVALGRLDRQKGFDLLVEAAAILRLRVPGLHVVIVGEGPERGNLERTIRERRLGDTVSLAGHQEEIGPLLAAAWVVAVPSRWEGFGLAAVEAQAAGRCVVASAVDSLPEVVDPACAGYMVPPDDVPALGRSLGELLQDRVRRETLGRSAARWARRFSIPAMVQGCASLYDELLAPHRGDRRGGLP